MGKVAPHLSAALALGFAASLFAAGLDDLSIARQALRDGVWHVAREHGRQVPGDEGRLIVLESFASENRWDDVRRELANIPPASTNIAFSYYRAVCDGDLQTAIRSLREAGSQAGEAESRMLEADLRLRLGDKDGARKLWQDVLSMTNASDRARSFAAMNVGDTSALRALSLSVASPSLKRQIALRLGILLLPKAETREEGEKLIRLTVSDNPDAAGASDAYVAMAVQEKTEGRFQEALRTLAEVTEIWPAAAQRVDVNEFRGETLLALDRSAEALASFEKALALSKDRSETARLLFKEGEALSALGRGEEAMARYRAVIETYADTETAVRLSRTIALRTREEEGRTAFRNYQFDEAHRIFSDVAREDPDRRERMAYLEVLCLYGLGRDDEAFSRARDLVARAQDDRVKALALLWMAKFSYNRGDWREAISRFSAFAKLRPQDPFAPKALLWAARAARQAEDFPLAIDLATRLNEAYPQDDALAPALLIQAEALIEQTRFDEALLVLEKAASSPRATVETRRDARLLTGDALFALGADNPACYDKALETYRAVREEASSDLKTRLLVSFKMGRVFEKLKKGDEAIDCYYSSVVLAYRDGRARGELRGSDGEMPFVRAAFRLADIFESRGLDYQAQGVLRLVVESDIPASREASKRLERISRKGLFP